MRSILCALAIVAVVFAASLAPACDVAVSSAVVVQPSVVSYAAPAVIAAPAVVAYATPAVVVATPFLVVDHVHHRNNFRARRSHCG